MNLMMAHSSSTQFVNLRLNMVRSAFVSLLWQTFTSHVTGGHFLDRWRRNFCNISLWVGFNRHWLWRWWEDHRLNSISRSITCKESHIASSFVVCKRKFHGPRVEIRWLHHFCSLNLWFGGSNYHFWKKQVRTNPSVTQISIIRFPPTVSKNSAKTRSQPIRLYWDECYKSGACWTVDPQQISSQYLQELSYFFFPSSPSFPAVNSIIFRLYCLYDGPHQIGQKCSSKCNSRLYGE